MDKITLLERLVSIKSNAIQRADLESQGDPIREISMRAYMLQCGIEQLIIEIQNVLITEYQAAGKPLSVGRASVKKLNLRNNI